ncbi:carotenoid biosynthesis protein [Spirosoma taeanense]|uniref:Carotenoid biosynthesis protein n=1 Tax=Spirosoma taeanense TaxID=2735870 RepID=A0A6M5YF50_9BACT|nr:carotenoid biosynthesis protein [Spirosoma taeanense]QJW91903.1 carotenoid biosynthesis protein [Spirosoma taeanense]
MPVSVPIPPRYHPTIRTVLVLAYLAGVIGLQLPGLADYFRPLSPLTLISSLVILLLYHTDWRPSFYLYAVLAALTGYFIEVLGVHTGAVFGHYAYGWGLGVKLWAVPPVIGINWLTLSYCCGSVCDRLRLPTASKIVTAASLMVLLDFFIEPVAVRLDFWTWFDQPVPWQNYFGWWLVSLLLFSLWYLLPFRKENRLAKWILALQFFFFITHNLFIFFT